MTVAEHIANARAMLAASGIEDPAAEASSLMQLAIGRERAFLIAYPEYQPTAEETEKFNSVVRRRSARQPFSQIAGVREFYGRDLIVTPDVLTPRPETEFLVEEALKFLSQLDSPRFCEVGVGSGCISISILAEIGAARAFTTDISPSAISVAMQNAKIHQVSDRIEIIETPYFDAVDQSGFDAVVTNPPYIPEVEIAELAPEVRDHEPLAALSGGESGFDAIEILIDRSRNMLRPGGILLMEIGYDQSPHTAELLKRYGWSDICFIRDLQNIERVAKATWQGK